jgi:hypothetical protein
MEIHIVASKTFCVVSSVQKRISSQIKGENTEIEVIEMNIK